MNPRFAIRVGLFVLALAWVPWGCEGQADGPPDQSQVVPAGWTAGGMERGWKFVVLHHSATATGSVESIDAEHRQRTDSQGNPWRGIGYHFVVGNGHGLDDGEIAPTFRWREQAAGAHAGSAEHNEHGIGICLIGNFEQDAPTPRQLESLRRLVGYLKSEYGIPTERVLKHGDLKATACPGRKFPAVEIAKTKPWDRRPVAVQK